MLIHIYNSYSNELILGPTKKTENVMRKTLHHDLQKYDVELEYQCGERWLARSSNGPNTVPLDIKQMKVDPKTCKPLNNEDKERLDAYLKPE